jgi:hypothetical protein
MGKITPTPGKVNQPTPKIITTPLTTQQQMLVEYKVNSESKKTWVAYLLWWFFGT